MPQGLFERCRSAPDSWHNEYMLKTAPQRVKVYEGSGSAPTGDKIWCVHFECYKFINVCSTRCRLRIKCNNYLDYWTPKLGF